MAEPVKTILLVDPDSLGRSVAASSGEDVGNQLADRLDEWIAAVEAGALIELAGTARTIVDKRCYVGPATADAVRETFTAAGFDIVERPNETADLSLAVDAMDAATTAAESTELILLTAAPDLTPLVERLKARGHRIVIYADDDTAADYRTAADTVLSAIDFAAFVGSDKAAAPTAPAQLPVERGKVEAFAREIHAATNIPLLSPKTFAELFRCLAEEVATRGYHFQETARNVVERLNDAGRSATARQVVFVVKGLALKGHVFSTSDTAERLAEVFREQARYLIGNANITLGEERERLLAAWIAAPRQAAAALAPVAPAGPAKVASDKPAQKSSTAKAGKATKPAAPSKPAKPPERPKSAALPPKPTPQPSKSETKRPSPAEVRAAISARFAASARAKLASRLPAAPAAKPKSSPAKPSPPSEANDSIESSILAAIAEAVDVLVEDSTGTEENPTPRGAKREPDEPARPAEADAEPPTDDEEERRRPRQRDPADRLFLQPQSRGRRTRLEGARVSRWQCIVPHWRSSLHR